MPVKLNLASRSRARRRAGASNLARRAELVSVASCVVSGHRTCGESRPKTHTATENLKRCYHRNQQYSIIALTNGGGTVTERYAYDAYGRPTITDAAATVLTSSADNNRYTYTGREFDEALGLYHYRARMYDSVAGRFCSRDPIGFEGSPWNLYEFLGSMALGAMDPNGLSIAGPTLDPPLPIPLPPSPPQLPPFPTPFDIFFNCAWDCHGDYEELSDTLQDGLELDEKVCADNYESCTDPAKVPTDSFENACEYLKDCESTRDTCDEEAKDRHEFAETNAEILLQHCVFNCAAPWGIPWPQPPPLNL